MFSVHCPRHRSNVLLGLDAIQRIEHGPDGLTIAYRCTCGHEGVTHEDRRRAHHRV